MQIRDKFEAMHTFPNPLTDDFLASVKDWESTVDEPDEASLALAEMHANSEPEVEVEVLGYFIPSSLACALISTKVL